MMGRAAVAIAIVIAGALAVVAAPAPAADLRPGVWLSPAEVRRLPERGPAWQQVKAVADQPLGRADISNQDNEHDTRTLAVALVYARTGQPRYYLKAAQAIMDAVGTERGGRTLALGRALVSYVVAADLIGLRDDPARAAPFRSWLEGVRRERLAPQARPTLIATHELAPNNWGAHAGASRIAADVYLGDTRDLARAAAVFKGWLGDRSVYSGFKFGDDLSWQANAKALVAVDPPGARRGGHAIDGALPDDMRRGCRLRFPPCATLYPWEALQGAVVQAEMLSRQGYDAWNWQHRALLRAANFLFGLDRAYPQAHWWAPRGNAWIPWLLNRRYGTRFPAHAPARTGKGMGYTDWTAGTVPCGRPCSAPNGPRRTVAHVAPARPNRGGDKRDTVTGAALAVLAVVLLAMVGAALLLRRGSVNRPASGRRA
jgi:hypothetical protein